MCILLSDPGSAHHIPGWCSNYWTWPWAFLFLQGPECSLTFLPALVELWKKNQAIPVAPHSSTLAWKIPWMEEPGRLQSMGSLESDTTEWLHFHFSLSCIGEGKGNPLQCSCLDNPRDGEAWWAAIYGVTQSRTRLKRLSSSSIGALEGELQAVDERSF